MLKKLKFKIPDHSFIAACADFKERQEYCELNLIPLLRKTNKNSKKSFTETFNTVKKSESLSKSDLRSLIKEISSNTEKSYGKTNVKDWINEVKKIIKLKIDDANKRLDELEAKLTESKIDYIVDILSNAEKLELLTYKINHLIIRVNKLNFNENSILERINLDDIKKIKILNSINNYLKELYSLNKKLNDISTFLEEAKNLKCSEIYDIIHSLSQYMDSLKLLESGKSLKLNIKSLINKNMNESLSYIKKLLIIQFSKLLRKYCNWGKFDNIVQQVLIKRSTNIADTEIEFSNINKNEKISQNLSTIFVLLSECRNLSLKCKTLVNTENNINNEDSLNTNICEETISVLTNELANTLKPLFFSKSSSLSNIEKPEWFLQIVLSIFKSHSQYLENLWYLLNLNNEKALRYTEKTKKVDNPNIPFYIDNEKYFKAMKEILEADPKQIFSISLISELRDFTRIYLKRILIKDGKVIRDNKIDCIFEKFVEQLLVQYRCWTEIDKNTSHFIMLDILKNLNIRNLIESKKNSSDCSINEDVALSNVEDLTKTAVNWAKNAFSTVIGDSDSEYLEIFKNSSSFALNCGLLDWLRVLNRIYVINQITNYKSESLVLSFLDKFNIKRTLKDLYKSICSYCNSSIKNNILKWLSETVLYMLNESNTQNAQPLIMPIKSSIRNDGDDFILVLGYSIETVELLNAFSAKIALFVNCCKSFEKNSLEKNVSNLAKLKFEDFFKNTIDYPPNIFINKFSRPIIEDSIICEFVNYIKNEWNKIGHKIGPLLPIASILIESVDIVNSAISNLNQVDTKEHIQSNCINPDFTSLLYSGPLKLLNEIKNEMICDIKLEIKEVFVKPLLYSEILIPSLNDLMNSNTFPGSARILFDDHLANKFNELKYMFILFDIFLSKDNLAEVSNVLNEN